MRPLAWYAQDALGVDLRDGDARVLRGEYHASVTVLHRLGS